MGRRTSSAIVAFQRDMGLTQDGQPGGDLLALLNSASSVARNSGSARPNRDYSPEQSAAPPSRSAPDALPRHQTQPASVGRDAKNFSVCVSGQHPSLCNHALLTPDEKVQVAAVRSEEHTSELQSLMRTSYA